jgi:hypothetical protein
MEDPLVLTARWLRIAHAAAQLKGAHGVQPRDWTPVFCRRLGERAASGLMAGIHGIKAVYSGSSNFATTTSVALNQTVS